MADCWKSFWHGWGRAARLWPVVVLLYLVDTTAALIMAMPVASQLSTVFGHSSMASELLGPASLDWLVELQEGSRLTAFPWLLYLLVPALFLVVATFLRGGVLGSLAGEPGSFLWMGFFSDCARHFWRLLLLLLFLVPGVLATVLIMVVGPRIGFSPSGALGLAPAAVRGVFLALLLFLLLTILDYARISLVLDPGRSLLRHAGRGLRFVVVRFPQVALLGLGFWIVAAIIAVLYPGLLRLSPAFESFWPALVAQQLAAILASWQRTAMLGGQMRLFAAGRRDEIPNLE